MKIQDQVVSLELAKRLKELGVKQESYFHWVKKDKKANGGLPTYYHLSNEFSLEHSISRLWIEDKISAFGVAELLELLPLFNGSPVELLKGFDIRNGLIYACRLTNLYNDHPPFVDKNPANACAKMLIYLIENKLIDNN